MYLWQHLFVDVSLKAYCFISSSSMAHFTCAMFSKFSAQQPSSPAQNTPSSSTLEMEDLEPERKYTCPQVGCLKAYRQSSGLRYHIKHVCRCSFFLVSLLKFLKGPSTRYACSTSHCPTYVGAADVCKNQEATTKAISRINHCLISNLLYFLFPHSRISHILLGNLSRSRMLSCTQSLSFSLLARH